MNALEYTLFVYYFILQQHQHNDNNEGGEKCPDSVHKELFRLLVNTHPMFTEKIDTLLPLYRKENTL